MLGCFRERKNNLSRSVIPASARMSSSSQAAKRDSLGSRASNSTVASARISGLRHSSSPPIARFIVAAVRIPVMGQSALAAIPWSEYSASSAIATRVIPIFEVRYGAFPTAALQR